MDKLNLPTREEALSALFECWEPTRGLEYIPLKDARNRVLAKDLKAKHSLPVQRSANMDGIAVCYEHLQKGNFEQWQKDIDYCMADTGDDFPDPFDTVIAIEAVDFLEGGGLSIDLSDGLVAGQSISGPGSNLKSGELLVAAGTTLNPLQLNLIASGGYINIPVIKKPKIVYIPTGSELISAGLRPRRGKNIESNGLMVESIAKAWGADVVGYPICEDILADLASMLDSAIAEADIVLINGGSSKGSEDFNSALLKERASHFQHRVLSAPGFPVGIALIEGKPVINVPGPPMACFTVMHWCVRALVYQALGIEIPFTSTSYAKLKADLAGSNALDFYVCAKIEREGTELWATPMTRGVRSAAMFGLCNAAIVLRAGCSYKAGDLIELEWLL